MYGASTIIIIYILFSKRLSLLVDHDSLHEMAGRKHAANHKKKWYEHSMIETTSRFHWVSPYLLRGY
jgi:hypothetical protein